MKILGISLGTKNGNNDTMCRVALEAAKEMGAEIEFIHLLDWNIDYCSGCVACSRGLVMGKGMICTRKDDYAALYNKIVGDAFAPRNPYCLKIDTLVEPPMFKVTDTHYAKTWLLDERAPKVEKPEIIHDIHEKLVKAFNI